MYSSTSDPTHANIEQVIAESEKSLAILDPLPDAESIPDPYELAGTCYVYHGDYPKAIAALKRFLAIEQASFAAFERKAAAGQGRYEGAESLKSAQRITGARQGNAYTWLSMAYLRSGDAADAVDAAAHARAQIGKPTRFTGNWPKLRSPRGVWTNQRRLSWKGAFVTSDGSLRKDLLDLYQRMGPGTCALKPCAWTGHQSRLHHGSLASLCGGGPEPLALCSARTRCKWLRRGRRCLSKSSAASCNRREPDIGIYWCAEKLKNAPILVNSCHGSHSVRG